MNPRASSLTALHFVGLRPLQLGSALTARDMFPGTAITFVAVAPALLDAAKAEGLESLDPASLPSAVAAPVKAE